MAGKKKYGDQPTKDFSITSTPEAVAGLDQMVKSLKLRSRSELITRIGLGQIPIAAEMLAGESSAN